MKFSDAEDITF